LPSVIVTLVVPVMSVVSLSRTSWLTRLPTAEFMSSVIQNQPPSMMGPSWNMLSSSSPEQARPLSMVSSVATTPSALAMSSPDRVTPSQLAT
jgi:hypothetical protein